MKAFSKKCVSEAKAMYTYCIYIYIKYHLYNTLIHVYCFFLELKSHVSVLEEINFYDFCES